MRAKINKADNSPEYGTSERCFISEIANDTDDPQVSIARARVLPGITTAWHRLEGVSERYIIVSGKGVVEVSALPPTEVGPGDVVLIPPGEVQRIKNIGEDDLVFYAVCNPRFTPECYTSLEEDHTHWKPL